MRDLARAWPDPTVATAVAKLPWGHVTVLLSHLGDTRQREWYASHAYTEGWSRGVLEDRIKGQLHARIGAAPSNFAHRLLETDSDLARQATRDPVLLDFLGLTGSAHERAVQQTRPDEAGRDSGA